MHHLASIQMCFIVGMGRSGTTLLMQILNAHPHALSTPETHFVMTFFQQYAQQKNINRREILDICARFYKSKKNNLSIWQWNFAQFEQYIHAAPAQNLDYEYVCKAFLASHIFLGNSKPNLTHIVAKEHDFTTYIPQLLQIFPNAKFIVCLRDYRAVIHSHCQSPNTRFVSNTFNALHWRENNQYLWQQSQAMPNKFLWIQYEKLVKNPTDTVKQLCHFIDLPFQPNLLHTQQNLQNWLEQQRQNPLMSARKLKKWTDLAQPINNTQSEKWRENLPYESLVFADLLCSQTGQLWGYKPLTRVGVPQKITYYIWHLPVLIYAHIALFVFIRQYYHLPLRIRILISKLFGTKNKF
jgi:hypothetical protein